MRPCSVFLCLLAATSGLSIKSKPHEKPHGLHTKDVITEEANNPQILATLLPFEGSSREQEDEEMSPEENANANKEEGETEVTERGEKSTAILMSDEELIELLKEDAEEEREAEERVLAEEGEKGEGKAESVETVEEEEDEVEKKTLKDKLGSEEKARAVEEEREVKQVSADAAGMTEEEEEMDVERMSLEKDAGEKTDQEEQGAWLEDDDGSTESEVPVDFDYAADSGVFQQIQFASVNKKTHTDDTKALPKKHAIEKEASEKGRPTITGDTEQSRESTKAGNGKKKRDQDSDVTSQEISEPSENVEPKEPRSSEESESPSRAAGKEGKKTRKQQKNQRARKHSPQREQTQSGQEESQQGRQQPEGSSADHTVPKAKRRRAGKWGRLVGMNPVQIRATADLYPSSRSSLDGAAHRPEATADPCDNFPCKRGKVCKLDADSKPGCACQEPSECPPSVNQYDHVCGTDNKTYDTSCELFATKCNLEGSKRGHRLHLDYFGPCKLIPACVETELIQFPLRMRDWLKNVLLQLYDHDSVSPGFLTPKQRFRVKKIFENERRLHAGDHSVELLAQDFEKNYNTYIYPVHWQFAQLDQHPSDRFLSHSELAPLRVPLVPMEHCTSHFFKECDADKDKQVSFKEWTSCFGIKEEDMDVNQLF